ncbi:MAG: 8-amino-7-oxononanoate synthase [Burkholderiaceae bacterium]
MLGRLHDELAVLDAQALRRCRRTADTPCGTQMNIDGRALLAFCSNDYLGLAAHPRVIAALQEGADRYGAGSGASHLISGHSRAHVLLEQRLGEFIRPHLAEARALTFSTGYMANLAVLSALGGPQAELFSEAVNHASLIDGARLSRSTVRVYPHSDTGVLEKLLQASAAQTKLVVTDNVFSMDGDLAPLPELLGLCERYGAWLVIDDAHGFGVLGRHGRGALEHFDLQSPQLIYMGTLGKAAGVAGAFVAAHETVIDFLIQRARPYIYTTAAPPALAHTLLTSMDIIQGAEGHHRRAHLRMLVERFGAILKLSHWQHPRSITPIQPLIIGSNEQALAAAAALDARGLWVPAIRPPTVAIGKARLRVTFSASHTLDDLARLVTVVHAIEKSSAGHFP